MDNYKIFQLEVLHIVSYVERYRAFEIVHSNDEFLCLFSDFYCHGVLHLKSKHDKSYIIEKDFRSFNSM